MYSFSFIVLKSDPIEFTVYAKIKTERIMIPMATALSITFYGTISPNPIVVIVVITQNIEATY